MMNEVLKKISLEFSEADIKWAVGASMMLYFHGLLDDPQDIDIIVTTDKVEEADEILSGLGSRYKNYDTADYSTRFFHEYSVDGYDIDLMAGFRINLTKMIYEYPFCENSAIESYDLDGTNIPLCPVEDWYLLYQLMINRENKISITEEYLKRNGVKHPDNLLAALEMPVPDHVKERIRNLLK